MINLNEYEFKISEMTAGIMAKKLITTPTGKKFIYKANMGFARNDEMPTSFGEVLYSYVCKILGCNCVNAFFACLDINNKSSHGVLIEHFWEEDTKEAINLGRIIRSVNNECSMCMKTSVDDVVNAVGRFASLHGLSVDSQRLRSDLVKMAILDYYFSQTDRHRGNIEFLISDKGLKMAPMFDNGACFNLSSHQVGGYITVSLNQYEKGDYQLLSITNEMYDYDEVDNLAKQIVVEMKNNKEIKKFVSDINDLKIGEILTTLYNRSAKEFDEVYLQNCQKIFEYRKDLVNCYKKNIIRPKVIIDNFEKSL